MSQAFSAGTFCGRSCRAFFRSPSTASSPVRKMEHSKSAPPSFGSSSSSLVACRTPFGILSNASARRFGLPLPFVPGPTARADIGWPWRMDWSGHDPATPIAEMHINYHNTGWAIMTFVCTSVFYILCKR
eukprot:TRINITY_DN3085_c1_g1_i2.p1 TRINITY_DN3085_c1_g1~~TRINITY_DN3085_c1_g1_i2.p1  ORF type:complete len:130 (-),score=5.58 TRINITY_DN3085_c1_g1_i2:213-602(-)